jgi:type I restriction enzyme R subunit
VVIEKLDAAMTELREFMQLQGVECEPSAAYNLKGDTARAQFVRLFKQVQRIKTQLDQYTDLTDTDKNNIEALLPKEQLQGFKGAYLETAKALRKLQTDEETPPEIQELDFEFVLFASTIIDYDYIMTLTSHYSSGSEEMTREQLTALIRSEAKFIDNSEEIIEYIGTLKVGEGLTKQEILDGFTHFKEEYYKRELNTIATTHQLEFNALQSFVNHTITRFILDSDALRDLFTPLDLSWKEKSKAEQALMKDLSPLLQKITQGQEITGLKAYVN